MRIEEYIYVESRKWQDKIAAFDSIKVLSYEELIINARKIASFFISNGIQKGDRICIISKRDPDGLALILATLFSGAIYVPISIEYPLKRKKYIINDCNPKIIVTDHIRLINKKFKPLIISKKLLLKKSVYFNNKFLDSTELTGEDIAYILYTSGSTGFPKGVMISHDATLNTLFWMKSTFETKMDDCIPQKTSWGFTDSIWELFLPLLVGGKVGFITDIENRNPIQLFNRLNEIQAVITQFVPPVLSVFLNVLEKEVQNPKFNCLRWILNGGEELPRNLVDRWFDAFPEIGYANTYGMTESAIYATCFLMTSKPVWGMRRIPIGTPIANEDVYILSDSDQILVNEEEGEICIGGKSLMHGYWGKEDISKKVLITHRELNRLIYKTGDLGKKRSDGLYSFLGRKDDQVKIRGMRVELEEVKGALLEYSEILETAIIVKGENENKFLVAFYTTKSKKPLKRDHLLFHLRRRLPTYMVPSYYHFLEEIPLTEHNKINYKLLYELENKNVHEIGIRSESRNPIEEDIFKIWKDVLCHDDFSKNDTFFNVGGNSLLLMNVYSRLPNQYRSKVKLLDLIENPSICSLSQVIDNRINLKNKTKKNRITRSRKVFYLSELRKKRNKGSVLS